MENRSKASHIFISAGYLWTSLSLVCTDFSVSMSNFDNFSSHQCNAFYKSKKAIKSFNGTNLPICVVEMGSHFWKEKLGDYVSGDADQILNDNHWGISRLEKYHSKKDKQAGSSALTLHMDSDYPAKAQPGKSGDKSRCSFRNKEVLPIQPCEAAIQLVASNTSISSISELARLILYSEDHLELHDTH